MLEQRSWTKAKNFQDKAETLSEDEEQEHMCVRSQIELH